MHAANEEVLVAVVVVIADGDAVVVAVPASPASAVTSVKWPLPSFSKSRLEYLGAVFFRDAISAPLVKKISRKPSLL